jgi:alanine racemase
VTCGARALIRLDALESNFKRIRDAAKGARVLAVVKANAYGHGLTTIAMNLPDADGFAVARFDEAMELHAAGLRKPIVLLEGVADEEEMEIALRRNFQPVVHCERQIELLESASAGRVGVWLKIDTGMRRLGFEPQGAAALIERLRACRSVGEMRLMTHFAMADERTNAMTSRQMAVFREALGQFEGDISVANSPALFAWSDAIAAGLEPQRTWVRAGICLYGISPFADGCGSELGLRPVMEFATTLIAVKPIRAGERVGYGATWEAAHDTVLGIFAAGYGDGYSRFIPSGTPVLVNGRRTKLAGRVSMDMAAADLGPDASDRIGAPVTLWGADLPVEEVARCAGTIPYQLVCGVTGRVRRLPVGHGPISW